MNWISPPQFVAVSLIVCITAYAIYRLLTAEPQEDDMYSNFPDLPKNPRFETYQDKGGDWRWRLRAANGLIVADSAEGYAKRGNALRAATSVRALLRWDEFPVPIVHYEAAKK